MDPNEIRKQVGIRQKRLDIKTIQMFLDLG